MLSSYLAAFNGLIFQVLVQLLSSHVNFNSNEIFLLLFLWVGMFLAGEGSVKEERHSSPARLQKPPHFVHFEPPPADFI